MNMREDFAYLYPPPRVVRRHSGYLDIGSVCFPLEIFKKFDFLFKQFSVRNRTQGLEINCQERPGLGAEEYSIECVAQKVVLSSASPRGQFYALSTLLQVMAFHEGSGRMPAFTLFDSPDIPFRGFMLPLDTAGFARLASVRDFLLKLALLKFNHFSLPAGAAGGEDLAMLAGLARRSGMEIMIIDSDPRAFFRFGSPGAGNRALPEMPLFYKESGEDGSAITDGWFDFFIDQYRAARAQGKRMAVWADGFALHPEWIRKLPPNVLVLNREAAPERAGPFQAAAMPFRKHHIRQVLCPVLCPRGRFIPDARSGLARAGAAFAVAKAWKLEGVMVAGGEEGNLCLLEGAAMLRFQAGCLLWSGRPPGPSSFSRWAVDRDEPDLFRVFSFLAQAEHRLPHSHCRYLFEDPVAAPFSRQGDPREVLAHFRKAALYLKKREVPSSELSGFLDFARELYAFIAAKVEFSGCFASLLREQNGPQNIVRLAARLEQESEKIKDRYLGLRAESGQAAGDAESLSGFASLRKRFAQLRQACSRPGAGSHLLAELNTDPGGVPGDGAV
jgi:hypothetical protein